jgi:hypothetical protein
MLQVSLPMLSPVFSPKVTISTSSSDSRLLLVLSCKGQRTAHRLMNVQFFLKNNGTYCTC